MKWIKNTGGKELTPKQQQERKKMLIYPLFFIVFGIVMFFIFAPSLKKETETMNGYNTEIPNPGNSELIGDKMKAYESESIKVTQENRTLDLQEEFDLIGKKEDIPVSTQTGETKKENKSGVSRSVSTYKDLTREMNNFYAAPVQVKEKEEKQQRDTFKNNQLQMMEQSYKLAAKYLGVNFPGEPAQPSPPVYAGEVTGTAKIYPVTSAGDETVSRLGVIDSACIKSNGFNMVGTDKLIERNTVNACVDREQVLLFGGTCGDQKILLRLLEPVRVGNVLIPRNTLVTGTAKLSGDRLEITVNNISRLGSVIPVSLTVFAANGQEGLSVPGNLERSTAKEVGANMGTGIGTSISLGGNAGEQVIADLGKNVIQGASQYLSKKVKLVKVTIKSNHAVILKNK